jgi:hypothetical protein
VTVLGQGDIALLRSFLTEENDFFMLEYKIKITTSFRTDSRSYNEQT